MKAMLLAAGRGSRLRPLTDTLPKPLVEVGEACLIEHAIAGLKSAGITEIVINVAYLAKKIMKHLGNGSRYGVTIEYSYEGEQSLGTGGGVFRALTLLGENPFWLLSADVWSRFSDFSLNTSKEQQAHLVMVANPSFHPEGDYALTKEGLIVRGNPRYTYAGISLISPSLFEGCEPGQFSLAPLLEKALECQTVTGQLFKGPWFNVGTERELLELRQYLQHPAHPEEQL